MVFLLLPTLAEMKNKGHIYFFIYGYKQFLLLIIESIGCSKFGCFKGSIGHFLLCFYEYFDFCFFSILEDNKDTWSHTLQSVVLWSFLYFCQNLCHYVYYWHFKSLGFDMWLNSLMLSNYNLKKICWCSPECYQQRGKYEI